MDKNQFLITCEDLHNNIKKRELKIEEHLTPKKTMESGLSVIDDSVWSQYINMINPDMYLGTAFSKLSKWTNAVKDHRYVKFDTDIYYSGDLLQDEYGNILRYKKIIYEDGREQYTLDPNGDWCVLERIIKPNEIADQLVRYCELRKDRKRYPIHMLQHEKTNAIYGFVSKDHVVLSDYDIYNTTMAYFENIPCTIQYEHSTFQMRLGIILDELAVDLGYDNSIKLRLSIGNSMFGRGSAYVMMGSFEKWCENGAMGWFTKMKKEWDNPGFIDGFELREQHRWKTPDKILEGMRDAMTEQIKNGDKYIYLLDNAKEITDSIIDERKDAVAQLQEKKFGLQKQEAENVYAILKTKVQQYQTNAFGVGRAIAEVARDTSNHQRQIDLEKIASHVMFSQLEPKKLKAL